MSGRRRKGSLTRLIAGFALGLTASHAAGQADTAGTTDVEVLQPITVRGQRVANLQPAGTYPAMATALRFDPQVDAQSRGLPEGQADITVRGGLFENTGFLLGAVTIFDPQTGHYAVELPLSPAFLSAPTVLTDVESGWQGFNASVATVSYRFSRVEPGGLLAVGAGSDNLLHTELRAGHAAALDGGGRLGAQFSVAGSRGDGTLPFGDHDFKRLSGQVQLLGEGGETNLLFGYHDKFFGWPGAYTGFASLPETDHTRLGLLLVDHLRRPAWGWWEIGAAYRWLRDDYDFDRRTAESGVPGSFEHETRSATLGLRGEARAASLDWAFSGQVIGDRLVRSTDLTNGDFNSRNYLSLSVVPAWRRYFDGGEVLTARAGLRVDMSSRDESALLPLLGLGLERPAGQGEISFGLEYSESSQLPGYTALNSPPTGLFGGNPALGREYAETVTLRAAYETAAWSLRGALFQRSDTDLVDWTFRRGAPFARQANPVDLEVDGAEVFFSRFGALLDVLASYTWLDKRADYGSAQVDASYYALNFARHRLTLAMLLRLRDWLDIRLDSEYRRQETNPLRSGRDDALIASLSLTARPAFAGNTYASLVLDNLTDSEFQEFPGTPAVGRQISVTIGVGW